MKYEFDISRRSVLRILIMNQFKFHHISLNQKLHSIDFENHVTFCQWFQHQMHIKNDFYLLILFILMR